KFHGLLRRDRQWQCFGISETDIFARENNDAPRDEPEILAGVEHFREPIHGAFFIRSAHTFDERTDRVVVRVASAIVYHRLLLYAFLGNSEREMNHACAVAGGDDPGIKRMRQFFTLRTTGLTEAGYRRRRGEHADLERI